MPVGRSVHDAMSRTIVFLLAHAGHEQQEKVEKCATKYGLSAYYGLDEGDEHVVPGIREFISKQDKPLEVVYIATNEQASSRMAYELYNETVLWRSKGKKPILFPFLREMEEISRASGIDRYFVSCSEWIPGSYALYLEGGVDDLVNYVGAMQTLGIWMWSPHSNDFFENDEYPLLFRFVT